MSSKQIACEITELGRTVRRPRVSSTICASAAATKTGPAWARDGDVLLFRAHSERAAMPALLEGLREGGWRPGEAT